MWSSLQILHRKEDVLLVFLCLASFNVRTFSSSSAAAWARISLLLWLNIIPLCIEIPDFLYSSMQWCTRIQFPFSGCFEYYNEHARTDSPGHVDFISLDMKIPAGIAGSHLNLFLIFEETSYGFHNNHTNLQTHSV